MSSYLHHLNLIDKIFLYLVWKMLTGDTLPKFLRNSARRASRRVRDAVIGYNPTIENDDQQKRA